MRKIKWGILSTSWFAREKVIPALKTCRHVELVAIAARDESKARAVAAELDRWIERGHAGDDWTVIASGALRK